MYALQNVSALTIFGHNGTCGTYGQIRAIKGKNDQIRVIKAK